MGTIEYTSHAAERMIERSITERQVRSALEDPDVKYPAKRGSDKMTAHKTFGTRTLRVIYLKEDDGSLTVITAMWQD